jgi:hypothetical protein
VAGLVEDPRRFARLREHARRPALETFAKRSDRPTLGEALADFAYDHSR